MLKGYNSDLQVRGRSYHVQTEDWGEANPFIVSRVFCNGAVLRTIKIPHEYLRGYGTSPKSESIRLALRSLHAEVVDKLIAGDFENQLL